jgi:hypothetical protein
VLLLPLLFQLGLILRGRFFVIMVMGLLFTEMFFSSCFPCFVCNAEDVDKVMDASCC